MQYTKYEVARTLRGGDALPQDWESASAAGESVAPGGNLQLAFLVVHQVVINAFQSARLASGRFKERFSVFRAFQGVLQHAQEGLTITHSHTRGPVVLGSMAWI